jgi:hypothetical protein
VLAQLAARHRLGRRHTHLGARGKGGRGWWLESWGRHRDLSEKPTPGIVALVFALVSIRFGSDGVMEVMVP